MAGAFTALTGAVSGVSSIYCGLEVSLWQGIHCSDGGSKWCE